MAKAKTVTLTPELDTKLQQWMGISQQLETAKAKEFELRESIVREAGFDLKKLKGTETLEIGKGWKLKVMKVQNCTLTNESGQTEKLLAALVLTANRPDLAQGLVKWKPEMSTKIYDELVDYMKQLSASNAEAGKELAMLLAAALTIKPGAPQLSLVAPDAKE